MLLLAWIKDGDATRARIMAAIRNTPGIHMAQLSERTGLAWSTVDYHLRVLRRSGVVRFQKRDRECHVFPEGFPVEREPWFAALRDDDTSRVLRYLLESPGLSVPRLSEDLGKTRKVMRRHLATLVDSGLVSRRGGVRPVFEPNVEAIRLLRPETLGAPGVPLDSPPN